MTFHNRLTKLVNTFFIASLVFYPLLSNVQIAHAEINQEIPFTGTLLDSADDAVPDGTYDMTFRLYDASTAGTCLYSAGGTCGTPTQISVTVTNGQFSIILGGTGTNALTGVDFNSADVYLGVLVETNAEMTPRHQMGAAAYAYNADTVDGISAASTATANQLLALDADLDFDLGAGDISATEAVFAGSFTGNGDVTLGNAVTDSITITGAIQGTNAFILDGATDDTNEVTIALGADPGSDITLTLPTSTGTLALTTDTSLDDAYNNGQSITVDGSGDLVVNLNNTEDFVIQDAGTPFATFADNGNVTFANELTVSGDILVNSQAHLADDIELTFGNTAADPDAAISWDATGNDLVIDMNDDTSQLWNINSTEVMRLGDPEDFGLGGSTGIDAIWALGNDFSDTYPFVRNNTVAFVSNVFDEVSENNTRIFTTKNIRSVSSDDTGSYNWGAVNLSIADNGTNDTGTYYGNAARANVRQSAGTINSINGIVGEAWIDDGFTGTVSDARGGVFSVVDLAAGDAHTITEADVVRAYTSLSGDATMPSLTIFDASSTIAGATAVTDFRGLNVADPNLGGTAAVTTAYGVYVDDQTSATTDYGIYVAGADTLALFVDADDVRFDENLVVGGSTSATETLSNGSFSLGGDDLFVAGTAGIEGNIYTDGALDVVGATTLGSTLDADGATTLDQVTIDTTDGAFVVSGSNTITLGDNNGTVSVNSSDWDISTTGAITGVAFDANGTGNSLSNVDGADLTADTLDFTEFADALALDAATSITGTAGETWSIARTLTDATSENGVVHTFTAEDTTSSTTAQYGLYLDNAASTEGLDALFVADNSDTDDAVGTVFKTIDAGGGFTNLFDIGGTLISAAEFTILDGGISEAAGWTDGGTDITLTTSTDNVGIGGASLAKLSVDGDTDEVQFLVQGHSTQTNELAIFENSAGTDIFSISESGSGNTSIATANRFTIAPGENLLVNVGGADDELTFSGNTNEASQAKTTFSHNLYTGTSDDQFAVGIESDVINALSAGIQKGALSIDLDGNASDNATSEIDAIKITQTTETGGIGTGIRIDASTFDYGTYIAGANTYALWADAADVRFDEDLIVGGSTSSTETIDEAGFTLGGDDLFVAGTAGIEGATFIDGTLDVDGDADFGSDLTVGSATETIENASFSLGGDDVFIADSLGVENHVYIDGNLLFQDTLGIGTAGTIGQVERIEFHDSNTPGNATRFVSNGDDNYIYYKWDDTSTGGIIFNADDDGGDRSQGRIIGDGAASNPQFGIADADGQFAISLVHDDYIEFSVNNDEKARIEDTGEFGIGTTTPGARLEVQVDDTDDEIGVLIDMDDTTNNPVALSIQNAGTGLSLLVDQGDGRFDEDLIVGGSTSATETLSNGSFSLGGDDLFVAGTAGIEGSVYTDGSFIAGATTTLSDGSLDSSGAFSFNTTNNQAITTGTGLFTAGGDIDVHGTTIELDEDNAGSGADLDIVANQGSDSDGTLRYSAANNRWEISNDGGSFAAISTGGGSTTLDDAYNNGQSITVDGSGDLVINLNNTEDFVIQDASTPFATFADNGNVTFANDFTVSDGAVNITDTADESALSVVSSAATTSGSILNITGDSVTTGSGIEYNFNNNALTSGTAFNIFHQPTAITADYSGTLFSINQTRTLTAAATRNDSGNIVSIAKSPTVNNASGTLNDSGHVMDLSYGGVETAGTLDWTGHVLNISTSGDGISSGSRGLNIGSGGASITESRDISALDISSSATTDSGAGIDIAAESLTSGTAANISVASNGLTSGRLLNLDHEASGITADFSGEIARVISNRTLTAATTRTDSGSNIFIERRPTVNNASGTLNDSGDVVNIDVVGTETSGTLNITADAIDVSMSGGGYGSGVNALDIGWSGLEGSSETRILSQNTLTFTSGTQSGAAYSLHGQTSISGSATNSGDFTTSNAPTGVNGYVSVNTSGSVEDISGGQFGVATTTAVDSEVIGAIGYVNNTGTATQALASGFGGQIIQTGAGTITLGSAYYAKAPIIAAGTLTNNYGLYVEDMTAGTNDYGVYVAGADTYALFVDADDVRFDEDLIVGGSTSATETLANGSFSLGGDDLFVAGTAGIEGSVYTDGSFIAGATTTLSDGSLDSSGAFSFNTTNNQAITTGTGLFTAGGAISANGTTLTLDADNAGSGADLDIVANQGSDSDGTLRYSASNNQWEISNDGGAFLGIGTAVSAAGWVDDGTNIRLNTSTDSVSIGTATALGKFTVDGDTDEIQLIIQGNGTQTSDLAVFETSAGADLFTISGTGTVTANGQVDLGDGGDTVAIDSSDWDISATGNLTGIGSITADGALSITDTANETALALTSSATTNHGATMTFDSLTTGNGLRISSDSADTNSRPLLNVVNDNTAAVGAIPLAIRQDAAGTGVSIDQDGAGIGLNIDHDDTGTTASVNIDRDGNNASNIVALNVDAANAGAGDGIAINVTGGSFDFNGSDIDLDPTGTTHLEIVDNTSDVFVIGQGGTNYIEIDSTDGSEWTRFRQKVRLHSQVRVEDDQQIRFGTDSDIRLGYDATSDFFDIDNTSTAGSTRLSLGTDTSATDVRVRDNSGNTLFQVRGDGALIHNGAFTLGDNGETGSIDTSDWDISTTGVVTGLGTVGTDGTITVSKAEDTAFLTLSDTTNADTASFYTGTGSPNGALTAAAGSLFLDQAGAVYVNTDDGTTWTDLASGGGGGGGWTDDGTVVRLTTATDNVTIGSASDLSANLGLDGNADEIQFLVQGNGTQTSDLVVFEDSAGGDLFTVSGAGVVTANGQVDLGDGGDTVSINSSDWDISTTGDITGAGAITADGTLTVSNDVFIDGSADEVQLLVQANSTQNSHVAVIENSGGTDLWSVTNTGTIAQSPQATSGGISTVGVLFDQSGATYTDTATAGSGTATQVWFNAFAQPTLAATNSSVTTTDAATWYINNAPAAGTNQTITNAHALLVDAGNATFDDDVIVGGETSRTETIAHSSFSLSGNDLFVAGSAGFEDNIYADSEIVVGNGGTGNISSNGDNNLQLRTNEGTSTSYIEIKADGQGNDIELNLNSTGKVTIDETLAAQSSQHFPLSVAMTINSGTQTGELHAAANELTVSGTASTAQNPLAGGATISAGSNVMRHDSTAASTGSLFGSVDLLIAGEDTAAFGQLGQAVGGASIVRTAGTGTIDEALGHFAGVIVQHASGTTTAVSGLNIQNVDQSSGSHTVTNEEGINVKLMNIASGGTSVGLDIEDVTGNTNNYGIRVQGGDTYAIFADADDVRFDEDLIVGGSTSSTETLSNGSFSLGGDDLFVAGTAGVEGSIYTDGSFIAGSTTTYADGSITDTDANADDLFDFSLAAGADSFRISTGNLRVGNGTPGTASMDGEDAYIEGELEVDGAVTLDGTLLASSTIDLNGDLAVADTDVSFDGASTTFTTTGAFTLTPGGAVLLGDGGDTMQINTSDWDISTTGAITGVAFDANGTGNSLSNVDGADLTADTLDFTEFADALALDAATSITGTAGETWSIARTLTDATSENGVVHTFTAEDTTSSTTAQYGLYLDNAASTEGLDALFVADNSDTDDVVGTVFKTVDAGGGFTNLFDISGTLISAAEFTILDGGISEAAGWTDGGTDITLSTSTDNVGIGGASLAKLSVDGDTDEVQLLIQANSTQNQKIIEIEDSSGTDYWRIDSDGDVVATDIQYAITSANNETLFTMTGDSVTTNSGASLSFDGLTSGIGVDVGTTSNAITTSNVFNVDHTASGITADATGAIGRFVSDRTLTAAATRTDTADTVRIDKDITVNNAGATYNDSGSALDVTYNATATSGTVSATGRGADISATNVHGYGVGAQLTIDTGTVSTYTHGSHSTLQLDGAAVQSGAFDSNTFSTGATGIFSHESTGTVNEAGGFLGAFVTSNVGTAGTVTLAAGGGGRVIHQTGGTITEAAGLAGRVMNTSTGTITTGAGLQVQSAFNPAGTLTTNYGIQIEDQTAGSTDIGLYIEGSDTYAIHVDADDVLFDEDLIVGGSTSTSETLANGDFSLGGDDLFVAGTAGIEGSVYTDGSFIAGATTTLSDGSLDSSGAFSFNTTNNQAITTGTGLFTAGGDFDVHGTVIELDEDNAGSGANIRILANQGSDSDGEIRYNASTDQWELSNDGGSFAAISTGGGSGLTDNTADAYDLQEGSNNYININTTNSSENIAFGNATTNPSFSFLGSGAVTINGSADGTDALVLTAGDILISDGDFDLSGGDFNITLDSADDVNLVKTAAVAASEEGMEIDFTAGAGDGSDIYRALVLDIASANHAASTDEVIGLDIDDIASADADGLESAIRIGDGWDRDLSFDTTSPIISIGNGGVLTFTDGTNTLMTLTDAGTTGDIHFTGDVDIDGGTIDGVDIGTAQASDITVDDLTVYDNSTFGNGFGDKIYMYGAIMGTTQALAFEGAGADSKETFFSITEPTTTDKTITFPNANMNFSVAANTGLVLDGSGFSASRTITLQDAAGTMAYLSDTLAPSMTDNTTDAYDLQQGSDNYININTTNSSEAITFGNATTNPTFDFLGTGTAGFDGPLAVDIASATVQAISVDYASATLSTAGAGLHIMAESGALAMTGDGTGRRMGIMQIETNSETTDTFNFAAFNVDIDGTSDSVWRVAQDGETFSDVAYNSGGADYAERFYSVQSDLAAGEIVCVDITRDNAVERCSGASDGNVMGIISDNPSIIGNTTDETVDNAHYAIVGMLGQVDAHVTNENGEIRVGDSLTSASIPGYAMKASPGDPTVGVALEDLSGETGMVNVLISRRNKSLTVESVEAEVAEHVAAMEIEDEVELMISGALETLNFDEDITAIVDGQIAGLNLTTTINDTIDQRIDGLGIDNSIDVALENYDVFAVLTADTQATLNQLGIDAAINDAVTASELQRQEEMSLMDGRIDALELTVADLVISVDDLAQEFTDLEARVAVLERLQEAAGVTVDGSESVEIASLQEFTEGIHVQKHATFGADTAGIARILEGDRYVQVEFEEEYEYQPIVTASPRGEANLFASFKYTVLDETTAGFRIKINQEVRHDLDFSWHAFAVEEGKIFVSDGTTEEIEIVIADGSDNAQESTIEIIVPQQPETIDVEDVPVVEEQVEESTEQEVTEDSTETETSSEIVEEEPAQEESIENTEEVTEEVFGPVLEEVIEEETIEEEDEVTTEEVVDVVETSTIEPVVEEVEEAPQVEEIIEEVVIEEPIVESSPEPAPAEEETINTESLQE